MNHWYVATTLPRAEIVAKHNLLNQEFEVFLPLATRHTKRRKRIVEEAVPLYPNYLFVNFDKDRDRWRSINGTRGIRKLMTDPLERPRPIQDGLIEKLIIRSNNGGFDEFDGNVKYSFRQGSHVQITSGPFAGFEGICVEALVNEVKITLEMFGRMTETRVPVEAVECIA